MSKRPSPAVARIQQIVTQVFGPTELIAVIPRVPVSATPPTPLFDVKAIDRS